MAFRFSSHSFFFSFLDHLGWREAVPAREKMDGRRYLRLGIFELQTFAWENTVCLRRRVEGAPHQPLLAKLRLDDWISAHPRYARLRCQHDGDRLGHHCVPARPAPTRADTIDKAVMTSTLPRRQMLPPLSCGGWRSTKLVWYSDDRSIRGGHGIAYK